ncbi:uncharacterized protein HMPREF1541_03586 [Cyphellophora europaea CBS 101466]|uniref:SUN domain-containing protein n=1 Tax=Cyphellophora europaea (strain CBS 101466) TaxID=1220924 RepID=W2RZ94_CYPE1|nr:uncharacterized protein HMPREF1541_03586 [Cyphellophora europaea CBS 101466]ETN41650.1 hypothetical protein HMPREF1541_03586 [Cyphellophora europaea CBS 101466]
MPPRKSMGRPRGATPARATRVSTGADVDTPPSRRTTRQATQKAASQSGETPSPNNPHLPDVQTRQSYAYGANAGPTLPDTLATENKYSIDAMAGHIEEVVDEEEPEPVEEPRDDDEEGSHRSQLSDIVEEENDDAHETSSQPSAFPSDIMDHSYNYERGVRRLRPTLVQPPAAPRRSPVKQISQTAQSARDTASRVTDTLSKRSGQAATQISGAVAAAFHWVADVVKGACESISKLPLSSLGAGLTAVLGVLLALGMLGSTVCFFYTRIGCSMIPTTGFGHNVHTGFHAICGDCQIPRTTIDLTNITSDDIHKVSSTLSNINKQIQDLERRLSYRIDSKYGTLESDLVLLKQQQTALSNHLADHVDQQSGPSSGNVASPLIPKINFFAPSNGAVVDPTRSTPTKEKQPSFFMRALKRGLGMTKYQAHPPSTAVIAWHDVGDCWCAAKTVPGQDFIRLAIDTKEMIYPTELVIEHFPASGNLDRGSTPRKIELWADFSHFSDEEWKQLQLVDMQEGNVLGGQYARLGNMKYDATGRTSHIQSGILNVNQYGLVHYAKGFVLRVTGNYGGENVCLYRVRLHGQPLAAPLAGAADEWYDQQGYEAEDG